MYLLARFFMDRKKKTQKNAYFSGLLASPARFERAAFRLGGERSILLSYGDKGLMCCPRRV